MPRPFNEIENLQFLVSWIRRIPAGAPEPVWAEVSADLGNTVGPRVYRDRFRNLVERYGGPQTEDDPSPKKKPARAKKATKTAAAGGAKGRGGKKRKMATPPPEYEEEEEAALATPPSEYEDENAEPQEPEKETELAGGGGTSE
ncbi:hypothetical protein EDC01DRAFT_788954 [Geopyxis carbonaria]|nr:hypothetical protein EDC01DRAFT_788954 [Geopyxis carbonaria]